MGSHINFDEKLFRYVENHTSPEPDLYKRLRYETLELGPISEMQISWVQGRFMQLLVRLLGAMKYLEVGVFTGYSTMAVAEAMAGGGKITALDISQDWTGMAQRYWKEAGIDNKIDLKLGDAGEAMQALLDAGKGETYDLAFIDADKPNIPNYFDYCLKLVRPGGLIIVDNVLWSGAVIDADDLSDDTVAIRAFNDAVMDDDRVFYSMLPVGDGLVLAQKK
ncbi:MAG: O-methyltransferase [Alphaproteobacteria bacterium]